MVILLFAVNGTGCRIAVLVVKATFAAATMTMLTRMRSDKVGFGIKVSLFVDVSVKVV